MIIMSFFEEYNEIKKIVEDNLCVFIDNINDNRRKKLYESMKYSLLAGGKRFRPVLHLATIKLLGGEMNKFIDSAIALEYIHTYSLIHDDLPSMDNDDFRRGKPTNHKVFGEAVAILSGDALLNTACSILLDKLNNNFEKNILLGCKFIFHASGINGMIAGQVVDIESENINIDTKTLDYIHINKTSKLIRSSILSAAYFMNANKDTIEKLDNYAKKIGLAFQISDDILDVEGDFNNLGKDIGSDISNNKSTFVSLYGIEQSKKILESVMDDAIKEIDKLENSNFLIELARFILNRKL